MQVKQESANTEENAFLPLKSVMVNVDIQDSIARVRMTQLYVNPPLDPQHESQSENKPVDMTYQFPKEKDVVISKMTITLNDKTIEAKVCEEEVAHNKYEDAMAAGNFAAMVKDSRENVSLHQMDVGNVLPGQ